MHPFAYRDRLQIDRRKLTDYLLSTSHPVGRAKAMFLATLGFGVADASALDQALRDLAHGAQVASSADTGFGRKYIVDGELVGPKGAASVRTIWIVEPSSEVARFVTAYPRSEQ